jgi:hypothetical protein
MNKVTDMQTELWVAYLYLFDEILVFIFFYPDTSTLKLITMSFSGWKKYIEEGDLVIIYMVSNLPRFYLRKSRPTAFFSDQTRDNMTPTFMKKGTTLNNRFGVYKHDDIIGKEYGSKVSPYHSYPNYYTHTKTLTHRWYPPTTEVSCICFTLHQSSGRLFYRIEHKSYILQIFHLLQHY